MEPLQADKVKPNPALPTGCLAGQARDSGASMFAPESLPVSPSLHVASLLTTKCKRTPKRPKSEHLIALYKYVRRPPRPSLISRRRDQAGGRRTGPGAIAGSAHDDDDHDKAEIIGRQTMRRCWRSRLAATIHSALRHLKSSHRRFFLLLAHSLTCLLLVLHHRQ